MNLRFTVSRALLVAVLAALALLAGCREPEASRAARPPAPAIPQLVHQSGGGAELMEFRPGQVQGVVMAAVKEIELPGVLETTGQVAFDDRRVANIVSRVTGRIEQVHVSQWDYVRRGQPIVTLYSPDFMTAEAEYLQAQQTVSAMAKEGTSNAEFARSLLEAARRKLDLLGVAPDQIAAIKTAAPLLTMRAPISGTVVQNSALRGSAVNPGDVLYYVGTLDKVWITADIYEDDLARVKVGQRLEAITTAFPDETFRGVITRISPNIDPATHTMQIRCEVNNPDFKLKPQMLARVRVVTRPGSALVVPQDALVFETDSYYAFVEVQSGLLERRKVAIASWNEQGYARVISGLKAGDKVVTGETLQVNALWHQAHGERPS
jgi:membrane fusion protein, copper/silver efflux system